MMFVMKALVIQLLRRHKGTPVRAARLEKKNVQRDPQGRKTLGFLMPLNSLSHGTKAERTKRLLDLDYAFSMQS